MCLIKVLGDLVNLQGGPAGEIVILNSLESELQALGFKVHVVTSDEVRGCVGGQVRQEGRADTIRLRPANNCSIYRYTSTTRTPIQ